MKLLIRSIKFIKIACSGIVVTMLASNVYEDLYKTGYHDNLFLTHATKIVKQVSKSSSQTVLDVGCSHGLGVQMLWREGMQANGVDISPTAVALATRVRASNTNCGTSYPSFQVGNATHLPFPDKSFDAIISSDVLEHIQPGDVPFMVREFCRVARSDMWLQIATRPEINRAPLNKLHKLRKHTDVSALHTTIRSTAQWMDAFRSSVQSVEEQQSVIHILCMRDLRLS